MGYDPAKHHRRSIRLRGHDYAQPGAYFVTLCTYGHALLFGDVVDDRVVLNATGRIAETGWRAIPRHFPAVELDTFVVMPNHIHGILVITDDARVGARHASPLLPGAPVGTTHAPDAAAMVGATHASPLPAGPKSGSLGAIVGSFKSAVTKQVNELRGTPDAPVWQRNYWEHVIRTEEALDAIREYIAANPARWALDRYHPAPAGPDPRAADIWRLL